MCYERGNRKRRCVSNLNEVNKVALGTIVVPLLFLCFFFDGFNHRRVSPQSAVAIMVSVNSTVFSRISECDLVFSSSRSVANRAWLLY